MEHVGGKRRLEEDTEMNGRRYMRRQEVEKEYVVSGAEHEKGQIPQHPGNLIQARIPKSEWSNCIVLRPHRRESGLTDEIIFYEILPRVQLESIYRFMVVCKKWHKVISRDLLFKTLQSRRCLSYPPWVLYLGGWDWMTPAIELSSLRCVHIPARADLTGSSNGLVCNTRSQGLTKYFLVRNPITKEVVAVQNSHKLQEIALAFEPSTSSNPSYFALVGWYITKVEIDGRCNETRTIGFTLYSSQTGKWRVAKAEVDICRKSFVEELTLMSENRTVYMGGRLYYKRYKDVFWLDIKGDTGGTVGVPIQEEDVPFGEIGDCNGELSYSFISHTHVEVWVLRSDKWVQKYGVSLSYIFRDNYYEELQHCCRNPVSELLSKTTEVVGSTEKKKIAGHRRVLPFEGGDDVLFWVWHERCLDSVGAIFSHNIKTGALRVLHNSHMRRFGYCFWSYRPSLAPVPKRGAAV